MSFCRNDRCKNNEVKRSILTLDSLCSTCYMRDMTYAKKTTPSIEYKCIEPRDFRNSKVMFYQYKINNTRST